MVVFWLAGALLLTWGVVWTLSYARMRRRGGEIPVENERDIDDRYFPRVLRNLLKGTLVPGWGESGEGHWRHGSIKMRRQLEPVSLYIGNLHLGALPHPVAALVVLGDLIIEDGCALPCDTWCIGNVTVGDGCHLRALMGEKSVTLGAGTVVDRWVDAGDVLHVGAAVTVAAGASAGLEVVLTHGFAGGRVSAPTVRAAGEDAPPVADPVDVLADADRWTALRHRQNGLVRAENRQLPQWFMPHSVTCKGDFHVRPGTQALYDLVSSGDIHIGNDSVVAGSIHADGDLWVGSRTLVTGSIACKNLTLESGAIVIRSAHVVRDAVLGPAAVVGLGESTGGLASAMGSVRLGSAAAVSRRVAAGNVVEA